MRHYKFNTQYLIFMASLLVFTPACNPFGKINSMSDTTAEMNNTTKDLLNTSNQMKTSTDQLAQQGKDIPAKMDSQLSKTDTVIGLTSDLTDLERQGGSLQIRGDVLERLRNAHSGGDKLAQASMYVQSFEFQTFTGTQEDAAQGKRELLFADAMNEFFATLNEFNSSVSKVSPFALKLIEKAPLFIANSQTNQQACFDALAATLHMVNRKQVENINKLNVTSKSQLDVETFYSLISKTMLKEKSINKGEISLSQVSAWEKIILDNHDMAIRLLQARQNTILGIVLDRTMPAKGFEYNLIQDEVALTEVVPENKLSDILLSGMDSLMKVGYSWTLNLDQLNIEQIQKYQEYLQAVLDTRSIIKSLGVTININGTLQAFMNTAKIQAQGQVGAAAGAARTGFVGVFNQVKSAQ